MSESDDPNRIAPIPGKTRQSKAVNYSLRPAKNIERKMMGEAFARLSPLRPLLEYRYVGFGSEFFNDFALYHQTLGIREMISIERDPDRTERCEFNRPYKCIKVEPGPASVILPQLSWEPRSIVWLDYTEKLDELILSDVRFVISQAQSGSVLVWSVNSEPWGGNRDEESGEKVDQAEWPAKRLNKLRSLVGATRVRGELKGSELAKWGLAKEFHAILKDEILRTLNDRNAATAAEDKLSFHQCFHFRYADGQRMLTVGGLLLNLQDANALGKSPFAGLQFIRDGGEAFEIKPPILTGREVRFLNRFLPCDNGDFPEPEWLSQDDLANYREIYRYYPVFTEAEL